MADTFAKRIPVILLFLSKGTPDQNSFFKVEIGDFENTEAPALKNMFRCLLIKK